MKRVQLSQGKFALVDDGDFDSVNRWKWSFQKMPTVDGYAVRVVKENGRYRKIYLHRFLCGFPTGKVIDHVDGDGLNNQRENLRVCVQHENISNQRKKKNNTSGFKGVSFHRRTGKWAAQITFQRVKRHIGLFPDAQSASDAYDQASKKTHGEFGLPNHKENLL